MNLKLNTKEFLSLCESFDVKNDEIIDELAETLYDQRDAIKECKFGKETKEKLFALRSDYVFVNHGSFGTVPRIIHDVHRKLLLQYVESEPDHFMRTLVQHSWKKALQIASNVLHCEDPNDLVFVDNATSGVQIASRTVASQMSPGDGILVPLFAYGAVVNGLKVVCREKQLRLITLPIKLPVLSSDELIDMISKALDDTNNIKLLVIDHISSATAIVWPVEAICRLCRAKNVAIIIDGAHCIGQIPLNLQEIQPDFYTTNLHKWAFAPKGCAVLYTSKKYQDIVQPPLVSWGYEGDYQTRFFQQATRDFTPFITSSLSIRFCELIGFERMMTYNHELCKSAAKMMMKRFETTHSQACTFDMNANMCLIPLPILDDVHLKEPQDHSQIAVSFMKILNAKYKIVCPVMSILGRIYVRISCNIYNEMNDYVRLCNAIEDIMTTFVDL